MPACRQTLEDVWRDAGPVDGTHMPGTLPRLDGAGMARLVARLLPTATAAHVYYLQVRHLQGRTRNDPWITFSKSPHAGWLASQHIDMLICSECLRMGSKDQGERALCIVLCVQTWRAFLRLLAIRSTGRCLETGYGLLHPVIQCLTPSPRAL